MSSFQNNQNKEEKKFEERILHLRRVSKKTSGGNYISFSALIAIGDGKGNIGLGIGRGLEVPPAIQKGIAQAKKHMIKLPLYKDTLPQRVLLKYKASRLLLKPAPPGTGLKLGGVVRTMLDIAGVQNASGKIMGSRNQITNAYAVMEAIKKMRTRIVSVDKKSLTVTKPVVADAEKAVSKDVKVESVAVEKKKTRKKAVKTVKS